MMSYAIGRQQTVEDLRAQLHDGVLILPATGTVQDVLSFHRSGEFVRSGETAARKALPRIRELLGA